MRIPDPRSRVVIRVIAAIVLVGAGALATHLPYVVASDCLDSDAAVTVLMGRHFAHGEITVFVWGMRYMGALEAWAFVPFSWFGGHDLLLSCLAALSLTAVQAVCVARIAARAQGQVFVAALVVTTASASTAFAQTTIYGGRLAATTLALLALDTIQEKPTTRRVVVSGLLAGAALYGDHLMVAWALPIALAAYRARALGRLVAAAAPWVVFDRVWFALTTGPKPGLADPWELPRNLRLLGLDGLPMMFGADWAASRQANFVPPAASVLWVALSLATISLALGAVVWLTRQWRRKEIADLLLVPIATAGIFVLGAVDIQSIRYLAPAWPALAILASIAAATRPAVGFAGATIAAANMILSVSHDAMHPHGAAAGRACRAEMSETATALTDVGVHGVWADYWDAYRLGLFMDERLPFAPFRGGADRRHVWTDLVRQARPVAYLLTDARGPRALREALDRVASARRVGRYDLYVLPQSLEEP